jgi:folate-dependent phosphoribosylglycinamide formyltransferase PurN
MNEMTVLLVMSSDKIAARALATVSVPRNVKIVVDRSGSGKRVMKLIRKGSLTIPLIIKMMLAEFRRPRFATFHRKDYEIRSNKDLIDIIGRENCKTILLFRAGLIINKKVLDAAERVLNIHSASLPKYGGLGVLQRAINDHAWEQKSTLHIVSTAIDEGEVLDVEPYTLHPDNSYFANEEVAYTAGAKLLERTLRGLAK